MLGKLSLFHLFQVCGCVCVSVCVYVYSCTHEYVSVCLSEKEIKSREEKERRKEGGERERDISYKNLKVQVASRVHPWILNAHGDSSGSM